MQCANQNFVLETLVNYIQSYEHFEVGVQKQVTLENQYIKLETFNLNPFFDTPGTDVTVQIDFFDLKIHKLINRLQFFLKSYDFPKQYIHCDDFTGFSYQSTQSCSEFLQEMIESYLNLGILKTNFNFYFQRDNVQIFATQTVATHLVGCWESIKMDFSGSKAIFEMFPAHTSCSFSREMKATAFVKDDSGIELKQKVIYYCNQSEKCS